ncbi:MAG: hypothetical protein J6M07_02010 [Ruminococcus sp.]|nr:hypothetical protein [Ruminococcus sp.]
MSKTSTFLILSISALLLTGCAAEKVHTESDEIPAAQEIVLNADESYPPETVPLPVMYIETKS